MSFSLLLKQIIYSSGLLGAFHRVRNKRTLTVVMFHRVLAKADHRWADADPVWTVSEPLFEECLVFFRKHYNVVSLDDVSMACRNGNALPDRALLITFDDGWADNEEYALKQLHEAGMPAVVFVVAGAVGKPELWQESVRRAYRGGYLTGSLKSSLWRASGNPDRRIEKPEDVESLIECLTRLPAPDRNNILANIRHPELPHMISAAQLDRLHRAGIDIGSHGLTHIPIPESGDCEGELRDSRNLLARLLSLPVSRAPVAFSFPHGLYDTESVEAAFSYGYELLFTSDARLNGTAGTSRASRVFGRVNIISQMIADEQGRMRPELLALWLFPRTHTPS